MRTSSRVLLLATILFGPMAALAAGSGSAPMPQVRVPEQQTPEQQAKSAYNTGVRALKKADKLAGDAGKATDAGKRDKATKRAGEGYRRALEKFEDAVALDPSMHEAWNYVGYTRRQLGDYEGALSAYDRALALSPGYAQAIEYRGQAYLKLSRLEDAKRAYLDLYAGNRALSDQLLNAMRAWIGTQRGEAPADAVALDEFEKWVDERATIAGQTAALTRTGAATSWN
jgi:tetratricopeptide (TPR) repeat protein